MRVIALLIPILLAACATPQHADLTSPDGSLTFHLALKSGQAMYNVKKDNRPVLLDSELGLNVGGDDFHSGMRLAEIDKASEYKDSYSVTHGKQAHIDYVANEQRFVFKNAQGQSLGLRVRVSDDGVAFRYELLGESTENVTVNKEFTGFAFPKDARAYLQEVAVAQSGWNHVNPSYEEYYQVDIPVGTESPSPAGWVFPALFHSGEDWLAITEAGMRGDWHASRLQSKSDGGVYKIGGPMAAEVTKAGELLASNKLPFNSPWRIIAVGSLADLVSSTLGTDLADPAKFSADGFQPGFASWSWAMLKDDSVNFDTSKQFIDYAASMHWPYTLIDADWDRRIGEEKVKELADYAASKNVGLLLWYNSAGDWNTTPYTPRNKLLTRESRHAEFAKLQKMGIKGVKIDFFPGDGRSVMQYYNDLASDAADFGLVVNFHGASLPRGLDRSYPNLMTMEAVRGFEFITFSQDAADRAAQHMAMLPFARNLFDPMDFTPTAFTEIPNIERRTTNGFEAALPVLFLSGIQHIAETAEGMAAQPDWLQQYMQGIPVLWDESRLVTGDPGKYVVIARRKGDKWYVVGINGESSPRDLTLNLDFLKGRNGEYIFDKAPRELAMGQVQASDALTVSLLPQGGFAMIFDSGK